MLILDYINWHYGVAPANILGLLRNYLIATWHRFLIGTHARTLLSPWHRARPSDINASGSFGDRLANGIVNFYIRIIAAIIRLVIILIGLATELILIIAFTALLMLWLLWPVIFIFLVSRGLALV